MGSFFVNSHPSPNVQSVIYVTKLIIFFRFAASVVKKRVLKTYTIFVFLIINMYLRIIEIKKGMQVKCKLVRFDWAMKYWIRDESSFPIFEGLIYSLLGERFTIKKMYESEDNYETDFDRFYGLDLLAEESQGRLILFEIQNNNEYAYFQRMLFGTSKLVTEYIHRGEGYEKVRKIYSINIVYFALGSGSDYVYHGKTEFRGLHNNELLNLTPFQRQTFKVDTVSQLYPEYYILRVNDFDKWSVVPIDQWIYFLNTGEIPDEANAPGLPEARERLKLDRLTKAELEAYYRHLDNVVILRDNINTERAEGRAEGLEEGRAEGRAEGLEEGIRLTARNFKQMGIGNEAIAKATGLSIAEIEQL